MKKIIILNAGSSSLKFKLYGIDEKNLVLEKKGEIDAIGQASGPKNHQIALDLLFQGFGRSRGFLAEIPSLVAIGHRVVYGGQEFNKPTLVTQEVINSLKKFNDLAPLHNPHILQAMQTVLDATKSKNHRTIPNYAVFDTMFYNHLPEVAKIYAIPYEYYEKGGIQRLGFHGLSHKNAYLQAKEKYKNVHKMISIHLGAGSSITAIKDGRAIETSIGFTPQEGLIMGTRSGDLDPGIVTYLMREYKLKEPDVSRLLNYESGILGITGISPEMTDTLYAAGYQVEDVNYRPSGRIQSLPDVYRDRAKLAIDLYTYRIKKYIGAYYGILGGLDVLAFGGKIGFGSSVIRNNVVTGLEHVLAKTKIISIQPDEELQIAKEIIPYLQIS